MQLDFLTPRVERLSADGAWTTLHPGGAIGRLRTPVVLLARELTVFSRFETAALPKNRRRQAARLHARTGAPYLNAAFLVIKSGADFGLWWWDAERVDALVRQRWGGQIPALRPETLAQPAGRGWRIVRLTEGQEAQYWRDGQLQASAWRRERFDAAAWAAFTRVQRGAEDAPETPPGPQALPIDYDGPAFSLSTTEITREQAVGAAGAALATTAICAALLLAGQGARLSSDAKEIEVETAEIQAQTPRAGALQGLETNRRRLAAYRQVEERTSPLSAAGAAIGIVAIQDLTPLALDVQEDSLSITLPYSAVGRADSLIADFEQSGYFYDVQPRTDAQNQRLVMEMKVREAAPPLSADLSAGPIAGG